MKEILTGIRPQPEFPNEDLSEDNATLLEFMMANVDLVYESHRMVEQASIVLRISHPSILHATGRVYDETERLAAVNHGVSIFEAINAIVGSKAVSSDYATADRHNSQLINLRQSKLTDYFEDALGEFTSTTPRTAEVVRASSSRFYDPLTTYSILGAAMSRKFELDSIPA